MRERIYNFIKILLVFLIGAATVFVVYYFLPSTIKETSNKGVLQYDGDLTITESGIAPAVSKIYDATVMVQTYNGNRVSSTGSGFIYKKNDTHAFVLTNHHVIEGYTKVNLVMSDDEVVEAEVLSSDVYIDLAILKIPVKKVKQVAVIGNSEESLLGDTIFTVGSPIGYEYRGSVTRGTLSGKNREVVVTVNNNEEWIMKVLQVDAAINPGNSGGPLANVKGEVIGINSLKLVENEVEGMGFAIPIEDAMSFAEILEKGETIQRPYIGISMVDITNTYLLNQNNIKVDPTIESGVVVVTVEEGLPADTAGLQKGDVITKIGNKAINTASYLKYELYKYQVGDEVPFTYVRGTSENTVKLLVTKKGD